MLTVASGRWALSTITTVAYGDLSPKTDLGKLVASAVMIVGIGFIALLTGSIAQRFLEAEVAEAEMATEVAADDIATELVRIRRQLERLEAALGPHGSAPA